MFAARITKWVFSTNAPNTLQYVQKSCFGFFELFDSDQKHRTIEARSEFLPRTHQIHSNMSKNHVVVLFELFHSGQKHHTCVGQYIPILALIDKSSPRESRSECLPRTHPIHSNMSKNQVLAFLNFLIPVKNIAPSCANIRINKQKFAARFTKWVFATNAPNTLQ